MPHLPSLIFDLALILVSAGFMTLLFKALKQPLVLGYIVAGILAGPHLHFLPVHITDTANVQTWADIGVIFLLFALGLEFSFKKLLAVGKTALLTATVAVGGMMITGFMVGHFLGWSNINCLFLGGMLAMSSTTIIIKAFNDLGMTDKPCAPQVFGVLIVEDLVAVILMVMLSTLSVSNKFNGGEMLVSISRLVFFLALWFIFGIFLVPTFLKKARKLMNEETLLIISLGLCLGMVVVAVKAGFSAALGAFIMGSVLAETNDVKRIEKLMEPLKNLFGAIFFVSVGMMVQPEILIQYAGPIGFLVLAVLLGQILHDRIPAFWPNSSIGHAIRVQSGSNRRIRLHHRRARVEPRCDRFVPISGHHRRFRHHHVHHTVHDQSCAARLSVSIPPLARKLGL